MNDPARCGIQAQGVVCAAWSEIAELRKDPGSAELTAHLRNADDQGVLATVAAWRAIVAAGWQERRFTDWGVIAAPRYLGRRRFADAFVRYRKHGLRGLSPLIVPHQSLHAVAGTLSIALKIHGPNFGVGGGPDHLGESLLVGMSMIQCGMVPGLWVVVSDMDSGTNDSPPTGHAVALALTTANANAGFTLELPSAHVSSGAAPLQVVDLANFLQAGGIGCWQAAIDGAGTVTLRSNASHASRIAA